MLWRECLMHRIIRVKHMYLLFVILVRQIFHTKNDSQIAKLLRVYVLNNMQSFLLTRQKQRKLQSINT